MVSEITADLRFRGHLTLRGHDLKIEIFKSCNFRFALSITGSEITANLRFRGHVTWRGHVTSKLKFSKIIILQGFENSIHFALSLTVSEINAKYFVHGHVTLREGHVTLRVM